MAKDPAFLFYSQDFQTGTQFFTDAQVGMYLRLMIAQHQHGHLSEKHMLHICKAHDEDVLSKFTKDEHGLYYNERLDSEINKRKTYTESRRNNAQQPKKQKVKRKKAYGKAYASHMENEIDNENINKIDKEIIVLFNESFIKEWKRWIEYKKTEHHDEFKSEDTELESIKNLHEISNGSIDSAKKIISNSIAHRWKGLFKLKKEDGTHKQQVNGSKQTGASQLLASIKDEFAARGKTNYGN